MTFSLTEKHAVF